LKQPDFLQLQLLCEGEDEVTFAAAAVAAALKVGAGAGPAKPGAPGGSKCAGWCGPPPGAAPEYSFALLPLRLAAFPLGEPSFNVC